MLPHPIRHRPRGGRVALCWGLSLLLLAGACRGPYRASHSAPLPVPPSARALLRSAPRRRAIVAENRRPGTTRWHLSSAPHRGWIQGYADRVSVQDGGRVGLYVSTPAARFRVLAFRMGYYGGQGARLVWTSEWVRGGVQRDVRVQPVTHMVEARWHRSLSFSVTRRWFPGDYLLKLVASTGAQSYVPLTVRDDASHAAVVILNGVTTWQAYNTWGGYSLYHGPPPQDSFDARARVVSFDRPYATGGGAGGFIANELPIVELAEKLGVDVTYETDIDLARRPNLLLHHRALISLGHDEYWSATMRYGVLRARDAGVNVAFLGSNADFRHIRLRASPLGPDREEVCYKVATEDPMYGIHDRRVTSDWRYGPVPRPESVLNGGLYRCNPVSANGVVVAGRSWLFRGTGLRRGRHIPNLFEDEYDGIAPYYPTPRTIEILARGRVRCHGVPGEADVTYYTVPRAGGVLDVGTSAWVAGITRRCVLRDVCSRRSRLLERMSVNVLRIFARGPLGVLHPSQPNLAALHMHLYDPVGFGPRSFNAS